MIDRRAAGLLNRLWVQHRMALIAMAIGLAVFEFVVTRIAPAPGEVGFLGGLMALMPRRVMEVAGADLALASPGGVIAFGYVHPFFLVLLSAWTIRVASSALAGEIGRGTIDLVAARPVPRWAHVLAAWAAIAAGLALLAGAAWSGTAIGLSVRPLGLTSRQVFGLATLTWLLFMGWAGLALFVSAMRRDAGSAITWTSGIIATSFVLDFLARLWDPLAWARPLSLFAYYRPQAAIGAGIDPADAIRLVAFALVLIAAAVAVFQRRDL